VDPVVYPIEVMFYERSTITSIRRWRENIIQSLGPMSSKSDVDARVRWHTTHIEEGEKYLSDLANNPSQLVSELSQKIFAAFTKYQKEQPIGLFGLSPQVRLCLLNIKEKLDELKNMSSSSNPHPTITRELADNYEHQACYLRLCAFLYTMWGRVEMEGQDEQFKKLLIDLLTSTHIYPESSELTGKTAFEHFKEGCHQNACRHGTLFSNDVSSVEKDAFYKAFVELCELQRGQQNTYNLPQIQNTPAQDIFQYSVQARNSILEEIRIKEDQNQPIDYSFYLQVFQDLKAIVNNHGDLPAAQRLGLLAEYASGSPSVGMQIAGVLTTIVGLSLFAGMITGVVASFGVSSLLSYGGLKLSLYLLTLLDFTPPLLLMGGGLGLTFFGQSRQGISRILDDISEAVLGATQDNVNGSGSPLCDNENGESLIMAPQ
jgi:hypothetical protein